MRKITEQAANAFNSNKNFRNGATAVVSTVADQTRRLFLYGSEILAFDNKTGALWFSLRGQLTTTTKERLKPWVHVYQKNFEGFASLPHGNAPIFDGGLYLLGDYPSTLAPGMAKEASRLVWGVQHGDFGSVRAALHAGGNAPTVALIEQALDLPRGNGRTEERKFCENYIREFLGIQKVA